MADYVYAVHDFLPEHEDEISFKAGERIEVLERDDLYGDGWWQGRNLQGVTGLFPKDYTTNDPPVLAAVPNIQTNGANTLHSLPEESDEASPSADTKNPVMAATMTDVQHALDQLAVNRTADNTSRRTFSFISGTGTETDRETGDEGDESGVESPEGWRGTNRQLLAQNAKKANQRAAAAETSKDRIAPPIPVEMSDESDADEEDMTGPISPPVTARATTFTVPESNGHEAGLDSADKTQDNVSINTPPAAVVALDHVAEADAALPSRSPLRSPISLSQANDIPPTSATGSNFLTTSSTASADSPDTPSPPGAFSQEPNLYSEPEPATIPTSPTVAFSPASVVIESKPTPAEAIVEPTPAPTRSVEAFAPVLQAALPSNPSPAASSIGIATAQPLPMSHPVTPPPNVPSVVAAQLGPQRVLTPVQSTPLSAHFPAPQSAATTASFPLAGWQIARPMSQTNSQNGSVDFPQPRDAGKQPPNEWSVEQVVEWAKSKSFDDTICSKFIEHEISGDVLLEMDVNMLKEIDITAFGKRMKIANAINELKRPTSYVSDGPGNNSGYTNISAYNTPFNNSSSFNAGPLSSGSMNNYLGQPFLQTSPMNVPSPIGLGYPYPGGAMHTRNQSMSSNAPSAMGDTYTEGNSMTMSSIGTIGAEQFAVRNIMQSAPANQLAYVPEEMGGTPAAGGAVDLSRSESDPGGIFASSGAKPGAGALGAAAALGGAVALTQSATVGPGSTIAEAAADPVPRTGSLRSKPPMVTLSPSIDGNFPGRPAPSTAARSQSTLSSNPTSGIITEGADEKEGETEREGAPRKSAERSAMSDGEVTTGLDRRMTTRKAVRASASSHMTATSDAKSDDRATTPVSSIPASPSLRTSTFGGTVGSRKKRNSDEPNGGLKPKSERLSFFGGSLGKARKPPPSDFSDTSPSVTSQPLEKPASSHRSLSRLYLGSQSRKSPRAPPPPIPTPGAGLASLPTSPKQPSTPPSRPTEGGTLRKRVHSSPPTATPNASRQRPPVADLEVKPGMTALEQIGTPDHQGWMRKRGESFNAWKLRFFVLKGPHLYYVKALTETKIKGYVNILGYKVVADENVHPGRYGFRIIHDTEKAHYFSSVEQSVVREWMKALMKATIGRDYSRPVVSSCNIPTIPLSVAQAMNPAPRPPSPTAREATQKALRRDNVNQLSSRDALVLMGMAGEPDSTDKARLDQFFNQDGKPGPGAEAPPRPSREMRRAPSTRASENTASDMELISWINSTIPSDTPPATDLSTTLADGFILFRLCESIKGSHSDTPDTLFTNPDSLEGMFKLFDFMLDNDVKIGSVSINDVRHGNREKIAQLVKSLRAWQEKREDLVNGMGKQGSSAGPWLAVG